MSYGVGHRRGSDLALLWSWHRPAATALISPLAREPPCAASVALKGQKKKKTVDKDIPHKILGNISFYELLSMKHSVRKKVDQFVPCFIYYTRSLYPKTMKFWMEISSIKMTQLKKFSFLVFYSIIIKYFLVFVFVLHAEQNYLARDSS